jgi:lipopolysaccharide/colanic/teichoic acid biosynthesis glycosyltransferase
MSYGRPFTLYKFNIFKYEQILEARARGEFIHTKTFERNDGVTHIGWILKQIYMDELPQFYSVLKGDLSIVGPRPVNLEVYETLMSAGVLDKNRVPGGITGNYQSHKETIGASANGLDKEYADYYQTQSWFKILFFDIKILLRTLKVIALARGV